MALLARTGASAIAVDVSLLDTPRWDQVAELTEAGTRLWAGTIPAALPEPADPARNPERNPERLADAVWKPWRELGLEARLAGSIVVTPACGLARTTRDGAAAALKLAKDVAGVLAERSLG